METNLALKALFKELNQKPVSYYPIYAKLMGEVAAGVYFAQLMFYYAVSENDEFEIKDKKLREQTGLSIREYVRAKKMVKRFKFMTVSRVGVPPVTKYKVDFDGLINALRNLHDGVKIELHDAVKNDVVQNNSNDGVQNDSHDGVKKLLYRDLKERYRRKNNTDTPDVASREEKPVAPNGASVGDDELKKTRAKSNRDLCLEAISEICMMELIYPKPKQKMPTNTSRMMRAYDFIERSPTKPTPELIVDKYGFRKNPPSWWCDDRRYDTLAFKRNQVPSPEDLVTTWNKWFLNENGVQKSNVRTERTSAAPGISRPSERSEFIGGVRSRGDQQR